MLTLADLHRAVQTTLASKRLGQPVFVRYFLLLASYKPEGATGRLPRLATAVQEWVGQPLERVYANGWQLTLQFREGATALVGVAPGRVRDPGIVQQQASPVSVDLMVIGNRGTLYHDINSADLLEEMATTRDDKVDAKIKDVIEKALRSGKPESVEAKP